MNANAFEAKTDNKITAMTSELFVFMPKRYRCSQSVATTRPWDFLMSLKDGLLFPLRREVCSGRRQGAAPNAFGVDLTNGDLPPSPRLRRARGDRRSLKLTTARRRQIPDR